MAAAGEEVVVVEVVVVDEVAIVTVTVAEGTVGSRTVNTATAVRGGVVDTAEVVDVVVGVAGEEDVEAMGAVTVVVAATVEEDVEVVIDTELHKVLAGLLRRACSGYR